MAKRSELPLMEPLSDGEFEELDDLLLSDDLPDDCMDSVTLEGFLTAIAIGPVTVTPEQWLPLVFRQRSRRSDARVSLHQDLRAGCQSHYAVLQLGDHDL